MFRAFFTSTDAF